MRYLVVMTVGICGHLLLVLYFHPQILWRILDLRISSMPQKNVLRIISLTERCGSVLLSTAVEY